MNQLLFVYRYYSVCYVLLSSTNIIHYALYEYSIY